MSDYSIYGGESMVETEDGDLTIDYRGQQGPLFWLALKTAILTLVTLGIYRFWAKTRIRKCFWSATAPGGDPMEYTGTGLEKLLGFLIAVAFLAVYLGILQLLLSFIGMSFFDMGDGTSPQDIVIQLVATYATLFAVLPFIFYAQYRARRYILSRTRWRGIRFGVEAAAWGYVWRALGHTFLTIISLGLLAPRGTFWLEKYKIDRTWYGTARFEQGGRWQELYPAMKHYFIAMAIILVPGGLAIAAEAPALFFFSVIGFFWMYYAIAYYYVNTFRIMGNAKVLDGRIGFRTAPRAVKVFWTYILGALLASTCAGLVASAFAIIAFGVLGDVNRLETIFAPGGPGVGGREIAAGALLLVGYVGMILLYGVFGMIFVSQPILEHYVQETVITNPEALDDVTQRARDEMVEAEGFADALDVGAAI